MQCAAMAIEDGAVLGKLFSHLSSEERITSLLYAFQEIRQPRTREVHARDVRELTFLLLPDGPIQEERDRRSRALARAGKNILEGDEAVGRGNELWETVCRIFGYDCEDEADDWWMEWGVLRERAAELDEQRVEGSEGGEEETTAPRTFDFSGMLAQVTSVDSES